MKKYKSEKEIKTKNTKEKVRYNKKIVSNQ